MEPLRIVAVYRVLLRARKGVQASSLVVAGGWSLTVCHRRIPDFSWGLALLLNGVVVVGTSLADALPGPRCEVRPWELPLASPVVSSKGRRGRGVRNASNGNLISCSARTSRHPFSSFSPSLPGLGPGLPFGSFSAQILHAAASPPPPPPSSVLWLWTDRWDPACLGLANVSWAWDNSSSAQGLPEVQPDPRRFPSEWWPPSEGERWWERRSSWEQAGTEGALQTLSAMKACKIWPVLSLSSPFPGP